MNSTFGNTAVNTWKRIKLQHIALVSGLAIAVGAAVALGTWEGDSAPPAVQSRVQSVVAQPRTQREFVYYLVGSRADAIALQSAINSEVAAYIVPEAGFEFAALVVDTPESEALVAYVARELMSYTPGAQIVDMRNR